MANRHLLRWRAPGRRDQERRDFAWLMVEVEKLRLREGLTQSALAKKIGKPKWDGKHSPTFLNRLCHALSSLKSRKVYLIDRDISFNSSYRCRSKRSSEQVKQLAHR